MRKSGVGKIILNRPDKINTMNFKIVDEIVDVLDVIDLDDEVIAVIITGAGKSFCSSVVTELEAHSNLFDSINFAFPHVKIGNDNREFGKTSNSCS